jgi:hypothetical protein
MSDRMPRDYVDAAKEIRRKHHGSKVRNPQGRG